MTANVLKRRYRASLEQARGVLEQQAQAAKLAVKANQDEAYYTYLRLENQIKGLDMALSLLDLEIKVST